MTQLRQSPHHSARIFNDDDNFWHSISVMTNKVRACLPNSPELRFAFHFRLLYHFAALPRQIQLTVRIDLSAFLCLSGTQRGHLMSYFSALLA